MPLSMREYSQLAGISERAARNRASSGHIRAKLVDGRWSISPDEARRAREGYRPVHGRQLGVSGFNQLSRVIGKKKVSRMASQRARARFEDFRQNPDVVLHQWAAGRNQQLSWLVVSNDMLDWLREKYEPAGINAPGHRIFSGRSVDVRVPEHDFEAIKRKALRTDVQPFEANAVIRVIPENVDRSILLIACEIADYRDIRSVDEASRLIKEEIGQ